MSHSGNPMTRKTWFIGGLLALLSATAFAR